MAAYYQISDDNGRKNHHGDGLIGQRVIVAGRDYSMCKRCDSGRSGCSSILEVRRTLNISNNTSVWIRDLGVPDCPRYLVNSSGIVIAIQESDCEFWHQRLPCDGPDVKDGCPPDNGEFDEKLTDAGDTMLYDIQPNFWAGFSKKH